MVRSVILLVVLASLLASISSAQVSPASGDPALSGGLEFGYFGGPGLQAYGMISNVAAGFPMNIKLALGYTSVEPGLSAEARRVFINDATNGIPEESGRQLDFRLDFMYPVDIFGLHRSFAFGGPRHARFVSNFKYIGGNEDFDVRSNQWGLGGGLESHFAMSRRIDLVVHLGLDYFFESTLSGHDTKYSPDGDNANGRDGYTYDDADEAINQPKVEPRIMMGLAWNF